MIWDFRIIRRRIFEKDVYQVHRVFYSDPLKTQPILIETYPASVIGLGPTQMLQDIESIVTAFDSPVLSIPEWDTSLEKR